MFYRAPVDWESLDRLPKAGGRGPEVGDRRSEVGGLALAGGAGELPDLLAALALAGGVDCARAYQQALVDGRLLDVLPVAGGRPQPGRRTRWVPYEDFTVAIEAREAVFTLEGFAENEGFESTPPRFYRRRELSGIISVCHTIGSPPAEGGATIWTYPIKWAGHVEWEDVSDESELTVKAMRWGAEWFEMATPSPTCILLPPDSEMWDQEWWDENTSGRDVGPHPTTRLYDSAGIPNFAALFPYIVDSATVKRIESVGSVSGPGGDATGLGEAQEVYTHEHTPCEAFAAAVAGKPWVLQQVWGPGAPDAATTVTWAADPQEPRKWSGREEQWTMTISGLTIGTRYRVRWVDRITGPQQEEFVALSGAYVFQRGVGCKHAVGDWEVWEQEIYYVGGDDMGLDNLMTAGGAPCSTPDRLTGLADQGGRLGLPPDLLTALGEAGGRGCAPVDGLVELVVSGGSGSEPLEVLALLPDAGSAGVRISVSDALGTLIEELAAAGGRDCDWPLYVPLALLPYIGYDWGPDTWLPRLWWVEAMEADTLLHTLVHVTLPGVYQA